MSSAATCAAHVGHAPGAGRASPSDAYRRRPATRDVAGRRSRPAAAPGSCAPPAPCPCRAAPPRRRCRGAAAGRPPAPGPGGRGARRRSSPGSPSGPSRPARRARRSRRRARASDTSANSPGSVSPSTRSTSGRVVVGRRAGASGRRTRRSRPVISDHDLAVGVVRAGRLDADGPAVLEHGDPVADLADLLQPVRDVDDRDARGGQLPDDAEQVAHLVVGEHRARLVHDDQPGVVRQRPRHADDLLARGGQPPHLAARRDLARDRAGRAARARRRSASPRRTKPSAARLVAEEDVLRHRQPVDEVELLVDRGDARPASRPAGWRSRPARPPSSISPASGRCAPASTLISVDLPAPFCPSRQCTSPARTSRSTPSSARTPGNVFTMPRISSRRRELVDRCGGHRSLADPLRRAEDVVAGEHGRRRRRRRAARARTARPAGCRWPAAATGGRRRCGSRRAGCGRAGPAPPRDDDHRGLKKLTSPASTCRRAGRRRGSSARRPTSPSAAPSATSSAVSAPVGRPAARPARGDVPALAAASASRASAAPPK